MPFVIPAIILGGAYVTGKIFEACGEMYKADALKDIVNEAPEMIGEMYSEMMTSLSKSLSI